MPNIRERVNIPRTVRPGGWWRVQPRAHVCDYHPNYLTGAAACLCALVFWHTMRMPPQTQSEFFCCGCSLVAKCVRAIAGRCDEAICESRAHDAEKMGKIKRLVMCVCAFDVCAHTPSSRHLHVRDNRTRATQTHTHNNVVCFRWLCVRANSIEATFILYV